MNTKKTLAAGAAVLAVALSAAACGDSDTDTTAAPTTAESTATTGTTENAAAHNQADVTFAQMMIPHHTQAVEMSDTLLGKQDIPESVTALAQQIKAAQSPEIDQLTAWLEQWGEPSPTPDDMPGHDMPGHEMPGMTGMPAMTDMPGMMSEQDMRALDDAQGTEAARLFLDLMIAHHEGAIEMARTEIDNGQSPDAVRMATAIVETQQQEIDTMRRLLTTV
ncbi:MAG TPA: DUF305 domain-containing protein [Nocardia sp.]|uniref:DUF305 domain-containing protein n=1 Tax=Nocardia sp. TaxID=1821 RepID=UPI002B4ADB3F|nr:DUF305 domain-containing protein [Nocardia sp.]HLS76974.1 DUF305 domain-containing protein [Nocardia sp.]